MTQPRHCLFRDTATGELTIVDPHGDVPKVDWDRVALIAAGTPEAMQAAKRLMGGGK